VRCKNSVVVEEEAVLLEVEIAMGEGRDPRAERCGNEDLLKCTFGPHGCLPFSHGEHFSPFDQSRSPGKHFVAQRISLMNIRQSLS
jgi:hypothetical protein